MKEAIWIVENLRSAQYNSILYPNRQRYAYRLEYIMFLKTSEYYKTIEDVVFKLIKIFERNKITKDTDLINLYKNTLEKTIHDLLYANRECFHWSISYWNSGNGWDEKGYPVKAKQLSEKIH